MTRSWNFTFIAANTVYSLWSLIQADKSWSDPTFSNSAYVPNQVCEYKFQNLTDGANFFRADSKKEAGFQLTSGSWDVDRSDRNNINLMNEYWSTDTVGAVLYVKVTSN